MEQRSQKRALITGGGTGIGLAIARSLGANGYEVFVAGRRLEILEASGFNPIQMDVTDRASIDEAVEVCGQIDVFVANAGRADTAPALKLTAATWDDMIAVNLTSVFHCAQSVLPQMKMRGHGRFIAVASTAALKGYRYTAAYAAAKHGVLGFIRCLALELANSGVTANAVCPGFTDTPLIDDALSNIEKKTGASREEALQQIVVANPQSRLIAPEEVAAAVAWIASDAAAAVNGQAIAIDGGETA
ncbi:SDR family NAD(P)-dependent oxidoreductase [Hyphomonas sp. KY3]|mgnify:CR=1 FL=1|jgi:NAD(P)-dependent dehydrogenase (short-subunit alcohol dehydrogenase family)|uniref:SDR family NAD(P)-dependent oxidoreductase n=1 Tax=Hyphomonas sp. KY3 TaxID=2016196 RepID=UPI001A906798|nr:SDR family NAD(P)-dependent oxidoreductase [Hyphomonas sp. KY3]QSR22064.1 3-hydroxyacyl-CoA dehydrogenase [Hyphomonas sp. KY3]